MSTKEYAEHKIIEYNALKKRYLELEDWKMAEYCENLAKEAEKEANG